jgi:hypothetical protein
MAGNTTYVSGNNVGGISGTHDMTSGKFNMQFGMQRNMGDHTWKFIAHDSGMCRTLLQW